MKHLPQTYIIANWKMHGSKVFALDFVGSLLQTFVPDNHVQMILCPPALYGQSLYESIDQAKTPSLFLGAQTLFGGLDPMGAFTGEISGSMLRDMGYRYVIVGHSERRQFFGEDEPEIVKKSLAAYNAGLIPIMCVGETHEQREADQTFQIIERQLESFLSCIPKQDDTPIIIAYEPVWAIGTGSVATPEQAELVHAWIHDYVARYAAPFAKRLSVVYGGSVKLESAEGLLSGPHINGLLIGGASLDPLVLAGIYNKAVIK